MNKIAKELALILSGALLGIAPSLIIETSPYYWGNDSKKLYFLFTFFVMLIGFGLFDWIGRFGNFLIRFVNKQRQVIGIIAPFEIEDRNSSWVSIKITEIETTLSQFKTSRLLNNNKIGNYPIIINPYGGTYPEDNVAELSTFNQIFEYVRTGGIFINIADIPFYYAYDKSLNRRVDTTPLAEGVYNYPLRPFLQTLITSKLQTYVYGLNPETDEGNLHISRIFILNDTANNLFKKSYAINSEETSPVIAIPYGKGYFVFSTITINTNNKNHLVDLLKKTFKLLNNETN